jgi:glycosyltransferase involved in cell wall biosynthesis
MALSLAPVMRVAFVSCGVPLGGTTTYMLFLASALRELGVPAEVFSFTAANPLAKEFCDAGIRVHAENESGLIYEKRLKNIHQKVAAFRPTAVISVLGAESFEFLRYVPAGVLRLGVFHDRAIRSEVFGPRYRAVLDHLIVVASYLQDDLRKLDRTFPCTYLAHGIPIPLDAPRTANPDSPLRLLYYGRLGILKGVRLFPDIVAALNRREIPFQWTIHGHGPEEQFLKTALEAEIRHGRIHFSAPVTYDQLAPLVRRHDVYVLASTTEGGPLTLLESMALGLVPVCGNIPCLVQEVITPANGFRVPRDDPDAYAEAIGRLHGDRNLLENMSRSARATITGEFSAEAMARRYVRFLELWQRPVTEPVWPDRIEAQPILGQNSFTFSALGRTARRMIKTLRSR